jgi:GNAT superfamily N-acetyltransferase
LEKELNGSKTQKDASHPGIEIITDRAAPLLPEMLSDCAAFFMSGFNEPPWDVYEYNFTSESARKELSRLISAILESAGAFVILREGKKAAGFSIVTDLGVVLQELKKVEKRKNLPADFHHPAHYFDALSQLLNVSHEEFNTIGYLADVVVDKKHRGKGNATTLIRTSLDYLAGTGKQHALAWTVNPAIVHVLGKLDFQPVPRIGLEGEGIDFTLKNDVLYPTLVYPLKTKVNPGTDPPIARHFFKTFRTSAFA